MRKTTMLLAGVGVILTLSACTSPPDEPTVPVTCLEALDAADQLVALSADTSAMFSDIMGGPVLDAFNAAFERDAAALEVSANELADYTDRIDILTARLSASDYAELSAQCRAEADK